MSLGLKYVRLPGASFFGFFGTYMVTEDWILPDCGFYPPEIVEALDFDGNVAVSLAPNGLLHIRKGMAFDGPSSIAWDRKENMQPSGVHDGLYRISRTGKVKRWRRLKLVADKLYGRHCYESGMWKWWSKANEWAVRVGGRKSAKPQPEQQLKVLGG